MWETLFCHRDQLSRIHGLSGVNPKRIYTSTVEGARAKGLLVKEKDNPDIKNVSKVAYLTSGGGIVQLTYYDGGAAADERVRVKEVEEVLMTE